jgi:hypothetical protein
MYQRENTFLSIYFIIFNNYRLRLLFINCSNQENSISIQYLLKYNLFPFLKKITLPIKYNLCIQSNLNHNII